MVQDHPSPLETMLCAHGAKTHLSWKWARRPPTGVPSLMSWGLASAGAEAFGVATPAPALVAATSTLVSPASSAPSLVRKPSGAGLALLVKGLVESRGLWCSHDILHPGRKLQGLTCGGHRHNLNLLGGMLGDPIRGTSPRLSPTRSLRLRAGPLSMLSLKRGIPADLQALACFRGLLKGLVHKCLGKEPVSPDVSVNEFFRLMTNRGVFQDMLSEPTTCQNEVRQVVADGRYHRLRDNLQKVYVRVF